MTYYLASGTSPQGPFSGEDCLPIDPTRVEMKWTEGGWKIVDGRYTTMDFGDEGLECVAALRVIKRYNFTSRCFVGRPNPSMVYFRR